VNKEDLKKRTKEFALRIFKFLMALEQNKAADVISFQLLKASSSVAANYRAACRGKSSADFLNKWIASVFPAVYQLLLRHQNCYFATKGSSERIWEKIFPYIGFPVACHREYQLKTVDEEIDENQNN